MELPRFSKSLLFELMFLVLLEIGGAVELNSLNAETLFQGMRHFSGIATHDYEWGAVASSRAWPAMAGKVVWIKAKPQASRIPSSYAALSIELPAQPYWNKRVRFRVNVARRGLPFSDQQAYAALFVRVQSADGSTVVLDNMSGVRRRIQGYAYTHDWQEVVVDVEGPPRDSCPLDGWSLPAFIQLGFLLCGGRGEVEIGGASFKEVFKSEAPVVTNTPGPWFGPPGLDVL